jgi:leader peptidase (prepilin peptidase)/N-methyltransferase
MILLYAVLGFLVGGLLNLLADLMPSKRGLRAPHCTHCDAPRPPVAWLATLGYLLGRGRCTHCGEPLPRRNVVVELTTAVALGYLAYEYGLTGYTLLLSVYMAILILVTVIDLEHRLVLNRLILPAILLALIAGFFTPGLNWKQVLVGGLIGFGLFYIVAMIYPGGMGAGDVKLAAFIGLITGFPDIFVAIVVTIFAGGFVSLFLVLTRIRSRRDYIPYGPFLVIGGVFALLWGEPIMDSYLEQEEEATAVESIVISVDNMDRVWARMSAMRGPVEPRRDGVELALDRAAVQGFSRLDPSPGPGLSPGPRLHPVARASSATHPALLRPPERYRGPGRG